MNDLYSISDVARIFDIRESRLRYWAQTDFLGPSLRRGGRWYYRFADLIQIRAAKELLDAGLSVQRVRKNLDALRELTPRLDRPASRMRVLSNGDTVVARDEGDVLFEPLSGQLVMDFSVSALSERVADVLALPTSQDFPETPVTHAIAPPERSLDAKPHDDHWTRPLTLVPALPDDDDSEFSSSDYRPVGDRAVDAYALGSAPKNDQAAIVPAVSQASRRIGSEGETDPKTLQRSSAPGRITVSAPQPDPAEKKSAYQHFTEGFEAEERGEMHAAEALYRRAIDQQPTLAAAHTNLGNLLYRRGDNTGARMAYEHALAVEPAQPEARYNLGNVLEDMGELELAIAEMRRVCWTHPDFADAHYNLGLLLARTGSLEQARVHLVRYLELDRQSEWAARAREFLAALA